MTDRPLLVVGALREEVRSLLRLLDGPRALGRGLVAGSLSGRAVVVGTTGDGARAARQGLEAALDRAGPVRALLGLGYAGGLDPALPAGAIVVGARVRVARSDGAPTPFDASWARATADALGARIGTLVTAPGLVATPEAKASLRAGGPGDALAVDLESDAWARVAASFGVPALVLRAVFDDAASAVPPWVVAATDAEGHVGGLRLVGGVMRGPARLGSLLRLARAARRLSAGLAQAAMAAAALAP